MLIPEFYFHIDVPDYSPDFTPDDASIPLPPGLEDSQNSSVFHAVPEESILSLNDSEVQRVVTHDDSGINSNELLQQQKNVTEEWEVISSTDGDPIKNNSFLDSSVYSEGNVSLDHHQPKPLDDQASPYNLNNIPSMKRPHSAREASTRTPPVRSKLFASTPASLQLGGGAQDAVDTVAHIQYIPEGTFLGEVMHKDGTLFSIMFQVCNYLQYL